MARHFKLTFANMNRWELLEMVSRASLHHVAADAGITQALKAGIDELTRPEHPTGGC